MRIIQFDTLDDAIECYGRENLIAIDCIKQIIFYTSHGCQPKFVFENECKPGRINGILIKSGYPVIHRKADLKLEILEKFLRNNGLNQFQTMYYCVVYRILRNRLADVIICDLVEKIHSTLLCGTPDANCSLR